MGLVLLLLLGSIGSLRGTGLQNPSRAKNDSFSRKNGSYDRENDSFIRKNGFYSRLNGSNNRNVRTVRMIFTDV
jgi:hypothetical protein